MKKYINRKFRKLDIAERLDELKRCGYFSESDFKMWSKADHLIDNAVAQHMIENVIGTFALPQGVAINFPLNNQFYCVPMVVEEPSVVAALSYAALMAEKAGGFLASADKPRIYGQIQLIDVPNIDQAAEAIQAHEQEILQAANAHMPAMVKRGGGAQTVHVRKLLSRDGKTPMLVVHVSIDTRDAMGANLVNSVCEAIAPLFERITGANVLLRILSNLADESLAHAKVSFPVSQLGVKGFSGEQVRDRIILANELAVIDPWRATTHNKGIMNGIDPVAIATGNDWRSIEAAAHAYAAKDGQYRSLTEWCADDDGNLCGSISLPIKVGTVGGSLQTNPAVAINQKMLGITSASELAALLAAVGLAQNFSALRALVSNGIQQGHMAMHARSVALSAGVPDPVFDAVVKRLIAEGEIKIWRAKEIAQELLDDD